MKPRLASTMPCMLKGSPGSVAGTRFRAGKLGVHAFHEKVSAESNQGNAEARGGSTKVIDKHRMLAILVPLPEVIPCRSHS